MDNVIIYARVSSKEQESEGYSIPAQLKLLQEYASKNSYLIVKEFTDVETAKKAGRTQFNAMLAFIEENTNIKHILVEKTDRLLRNMVDFVAIERLMNELGVTIHLIKEGEKLNKNSVSNAKFIFGIKVLMAKNYVDNLSEETKKGMLEKAEQGVYPSVAPYGYLNIEASDGRKIIELDPDAAPFIRKMFEWYATGNYSLATLRKKIIAEGLIYRNGKNFHKSTVESILKNEFYTGIFYWKDKKYEKASHTAIVDKALFRQVQDVLINPYKSKSKKDMFPYTNLIRCGLCGCSLTAEVQKNKYIYYHCTGYKGNCNQPYLRQETIEREFEVLLGTIHIPEDKQKMILQGLRDSFKDKVEFHNGCIKQLQRQMQTIQDRVDQAYLDKLDKKISEDFWLAQTRKWLEEKERLTIKFLGHQKADTNYLENANLVFELAQKAVTLFKRRSSEQKRMLINLLVSNCSYSGKSIDVQLKNPFDHIMKVTKSGKWLPE